ncbi:hypothetical protein BGX31_001793 [Mortierella sp. GBA43]|nr:hypothetical protein BGX31_001793 [Mortierella sp. GBA43]
MALRKQPVGILTLGLVLVSLLCVLVLATSAEHQHQSQELQRRADLSPPEQTIRLNLDHAFYDSGEFADDELAATAVSPFCKSFTFLCHIRCLQRGDAKDPGNVKDSVPTKRSEDNIGEINRCSHIPDSDTLQVLCLCNNGVDLTAEVDYALEGVVDIQAVGGDGSGTGEAGMIRTVAYIQTKTKIEYRTITETVTATVTETETCSPQATSEPTSPGLDLKDNAKPSGITLSKVQAPPAV